MMRAWRFAIDLARAADRNRLTGLAAEVTFFGLISIFPGLLILAGSLGSLESLLGHDLAAESEAAVIGFLRLVLTDRAAFVIDAVHELFRQESGGLLTTAALIGLYTLSTGFAAMIEALDLAYGVREERSWLSVRLTAGVLAVGSVLVMIIVLIGVVTGPLMGGGQYLARVVGLGEAFSFAWDWLRAPAAFALLVVWTTTIYHLAPARRARTAFAQDLPGGLLASILLLAVSYGFQIYLNVAAGFNKILGLLGGGLILMMWLYLISLAVLVGGQLNGILRDRRAG